jgi:HPt (histidine-containing phosphotransfer) domain-containing protein
MLTGCDSGVCDDAEFGSPLADKGANSVSANDTVLDAPRHNREAISQCDRESRPIDLSILAQISGGNRSIELRMLGAFRKSNDADAAALEDAIGRHDIVAVARVSHRLVGAGRIAGAIALANICEAIEQAALAGNWGGVATNCDECYREFARINTYLCTIEKI